MDAVFNRVSREREQQFLVDHGHFERTFDPLFLPQRLGNRHENRHSLALVLVLDEQMGHLLSEDSSDSVGLPAQDLHLPRLAHVQRRLDQDIVSAAAVPGVQQVAPAPRIEAQDHDGGEVVGSTGAATARVYAPGDTDVALPGVVEFRPSRRHDLDVPLLVGESEHAIAMRIVRAVEQSLAAQLWTVHHLGPERRRTHRPDSLVGRPLPFEHQHRVIDAVILGPHALRARTESRSRSGVALGVGDGRIALGALFDDLGVDVVDPVEPARAFRTANDQRTGDGLVVAEAVVELADHGEQARHWIQERAGPEEVRARTQHADDDLEEERLDVPLAPVFFVRVFVLLDVVVDEQQRVPAAMPGLDGHAANLRAVSQVQASRGPLLTAVLRRLHGAELGLDQFVVFEVRLDRTDLVVGPVGIELAQADRRVRSGNGDELRHLVHEHRLAGAPEPNQRRRRMRYHVDPIRGPSTVRLGEDAGHFLRRLDVGLGEEVERHTEGVGVSDQHVRLAAVPPARQKALASLLLGVVVHRAVVSGQRPERRLAGLGNAVSHQLYIAVRYIPKILRALMHNVLSARSTVSVTP